MILGVSNPCKETRRDGVSSNGVRFEAAISLVLAAHQVPQRCNQCKLAVPVFLFFSHATQQQNRLRHKNLIPQYETSLAYPRHSIPPPKMRTAEEEEGGTRHVARI